MLNWTRRLTPDGVIFYPPEGRKAGLVRVVERIAPVRRVRDIRAEHVRLVTWESVAPTISDPVRLVTDEGEHAVTYELIGRAGDEPVLIAVGLVYGAEFYATVIAFSTVPEMWDAFRHGVQYITRNMPLGLGRVRRRRYEYTPPAGWQALAKPHSVSWYPKDFPRNRSVIRVYDAKPATKATPIILEKRLFEDPQNDLHSVLDSTIYTCDNDTGLSGAYEVTRGCSPDGAEAVIVRVSLTDNRFTYNLRLEAADPGAKESVRIFDAAVRSVVAIPLPGVDKEDESSSLIHWVE